MTFSLTFSPVSPFGPCSPMSPCQRKNGIFNIVIHCINCTQALLPIVHCCFMVKHNRENRLSVVTLMNLTSNELEVYIVHCIYLPRFIVKKKKKRGYFCHWSSGDDTLCPSYV